MAANLTDIKIKQKMGIQLTQNESDKLTRHINNVDGQIKRRRAANHQFHFQIHKKGRFEDSEKVPETFRGKKYELFLTRFQRFEKEQKKLGFTLQEIFLMAVSLADTQTFEYQEKVESETLMKMLGILFDQLVISKTTFSKGSINWTLVDQMFDGYDFKTDDDEVIVQLKKHKPDYDWSGISITREKK